MLALAPDTKRFPRLKPLRLSDAVPVVQKMTKAELTEELQLLFGMGLLLTSYLSLVTLVMDELRLRFGESGVFANLIETMPTNQLIQAKDNMLRSNSPLYAVPLTVIQDELALRQLLA